MTTFVGPPSNAIRNKPITSELKQVLDGAAQATGVDTIQITSGGQDALGEGTRRTGSTRHDRGRAADLQLLVGGTAQTFTDQSASPVVLAFVRAAAAAGAIGIGAGVQYMGNRTIHVGFGTSTSDRSRLTWGAGGRSVNAPQWLRDAAAAGWNSPGPVGGINPDPVGGSNTGGAVAPGRYVVMARPGLKLRGGPGTSFEVLRELPFGTELNVIVADMHDPSWMYVDLEADGVVDGCVLASFLAPADSPDT
jgi:hypothetical protein